jgi:hypothetical protein
MGKLSLEYTKNLIDGENYYSLSEADFRTFNSSILGLGDISKDGKYFEALAAIFDLEAFTSFCNQIDPHLVVTEYLNEFLKWLFDQIAEEFTKRTENDQVYLWGQLPFFAKFLGDGVLFLWDTRDLDPWDMGNVVISLENICGKYQRFFLPMIRKRVSKPPIKLRCGIARGQIISIGDEEDFVGPCINVASRLQKIGQFSFAFSKRGFTLDRGFANSHKTRFTMIKIAIRGVGDEELVFVQTAEYMTLSKEERESLLP